MVAITEEDVIEAYNLLEKSSTLHDLGIGSLTWWRCAATCSRHGLIIRYEETVGGPPSHVNLSCLACAKEGVKRSCPIEELNIVVGRQLPIVEGPP